MRPDPVAAAAGHWRDHGWDAAAPGMAAITSILRAYRLYQTRMDAHLKEFGLNASRYEVLLLLFFSRHGSLALGVISDRLDLSPAAITHAVNRLEADGLVRRVTNPSDGRGVYAVLTPGGKYLAQAATEVVNANLFEVVGLDQAELDSLISSLATIRRNLSRQVTTATGATGMVRGRGTGAPADT